MLGKAPPYLISLVTIAALTHSTRFSRYIALVIPKANTSFGCLYLQFSAANDCNELQKSLKLESYISLTNFKHQLSEQLTNHRTCTQHICVQVHVFCSFEPQYLYLYIHLLHIYHSSVNAKL